MTSPDNGRMGAAGNPSTNDADVLVREIGEARDAHQVKMTRALFQTHEMAKTIATLARGDTYTVVLSRPVDGALNARADGMVDAFVKGRDGKIVAVARLQKAAPRCSPQPHRFLAS